MKQLLKLREWLTLDEAAESLGLLFGEDIGPAELVRLALDGQLTLSVRFVNYAYARRGSLISAEEARQIEFDFLGQKIVVPSGVRIGDRWVMELERDVMRLTGVWDLPMIGGESLDAEHYYQTLTFGPAVELMSPAGVFVSGQGYYWQLQDHFSQNPHFDQTKLKQPWADPQNFYAAGMLPNDAVYVIRPDSFRDLIARVQAEPNAAWEVVSVTAPQESDANDTKAPAAQSPPRGGKPLSALWPDWVAELVAHIHDEGVPDGVGSAGQDALIGTIEERLAVRGLGAPGRSTVQSTARAVLRRLRDA